MVVRTILALLFVTGFAVLGFVHARLPKPTPSRIPRIVGVFLFPVLALPVSHLPWPFRVGTVGATIVAVSIAWYFGARDRKRDGISPFAHAPFPEGHKPTLGARYLRLITPMRFIVVLVAFVSCFVLLVGSLETRVEVRESEASERWPCSRQDAARQFRNGVVRWW